MFIHGHQTGQLLLWWPTSHKANQVLRKALRALVLHQPIWMWFLSSERNWKMSSTQAGWTSPKEETRVPCPAAPSPVQLLVPAVNQAPAPVPVRVRAPVKHLSSIPAFAKPIVAARDQVTCPASVMVQDQDLVLVLTKDPPFPLCLTACFLKGLLLPPSQILSTPLPRAFLLSQTSWARCQCIPPACCWCATAVWPISS